MSLEHIRPSKDIKKSQSLFILINNRDLGKKRVRKFVKVQCLSQSKGRGLIRSPLLSLL